MSAFAVLATLATASGTSAPPEPHWVPVDFRAAWAGAGGRQGQADLVVPVMENEMGAALMCDDHGLGVWIATKPVDYSVAFEDYFGRTRLGKGRLIVDGEEVAAGKWGYYPTRGIVQPLGHDATAAVYNAVITRAPVTLVFRKDSTTVDLPPVDDVFKAWSKGCRARGSF